MKTYIWLCGLRNCIVPWPGTFLSKCSQIQVMFEQVCHRKSQGSWLNHSVPIHPTEFATCSFFFVPSVFGETCDYNNLFMSFLACSAPQCQTPKVLAQRLSPPLQSSHRVIESSVRFHQGRDSQVLEEEMAESKACHLAAQDAQDWPVGLHSQKWDWNKWSEKKL